MRPDPSQKALRRLVAGLAKAGPADIEAVLARLGPSERRQVERLLASYRRGGRPAEVTPIAPGMAPIEQLSPWLGDRIDGGTKAERMTETAASALQAAATALRRDGGAVRPAQAEASAPRRVSLVGRLRLVASRRGPK